VSAPSDPLTAFSAAVRLLGETAEKARKHGFRLLTHNYYGPRARDQFTTIWRSFLVLRNTFPSETHPSVAAQLNQVEPLIGRLFAPRIAALPPPEALKDAKTRLQEHLQSRSLTLPRYTVLGIEGADHAQTFRVSCEVPGLQLRVEGGGSSRRRAEQEAAEHMLSAIAGAAAGAAR